MKRLMMNKKVRYYLTILILLFGFYAFKQSDRINYTHKGCSLDSTASPQYIKRLISYNKIYPFIHYNQNYIEWNDYSSVSGVFSKLKQTKSYKLKVLHVGDSHVQADIFTGYIRDELQNVFGDGGRGFVFPYAAASTHAAYDYRTSCKGKWDYSRNIQPYPVYDIGITGATIHTEDSTASFKLVFNKGALKNNFNLLKLYCKRSPESYNLKLKASGITAPLYIDCNSFNEKLYIGIKLPVASDTLEFIINKTDTAQKYFECYGLMIETNEDNGILYNSVGINGAGLASIMKENLLLYQLSEVKPDLVVLDLGLNDFYKVQFNNTEIEKNLCSIIDIIERASPDASIILCSGQDVYYQYWDEANCKTYTKLMREIAFRKGCAFYDYYYVSGGQYSMMKWQTNQLARYDRVHLTAPGYYVRGELFCNALLNSYLTSLTTSEKKSLIAAKDFPDTIKLAVRTANKIITEIRDTDVTTSSIQEQKLVWTTETNYYQIRSGDNLSTIAQKYGVSVKQIQTWNNLKGTAIMTGKTLIIYKQKLTNSNGIAQPNVTQLIQQKKLQQSYKPTNTVTPVNKVPKGTTKYTVQNGDNLWNIAVKFGTTVQQIKNLNNLTNDALRPGMLLIIGK
jgi:LysM repeat protein